MKKKIILLMILMNILFYNKVLAYEQYLEGEKVNYKGEDYYVLSYSDENTNYVTMIKENALTVDEINNYGKDESGNLFVNKYNVNEDDQEKKVYDFGNKTGGIAFYSSDKCSSTYYMAPWGLSVLDSIEDECQSDYSNSDIKKLVDNWSKDKIDDLVEVNGYKSRILNISELESNFNYYFYVNSYYNTSYMKNGNRPEWLIKIFYGNNFWINNDRNYNKDTNKVGVSSRSDIYFYKVFYINAVKPVINLNKCALGDEDKKCMQKIEGDICTKKKLKYKEYKVCSQVEYNGDKYYVIEKNDASKDYITLLKANPLTPSDINNNSDEVIGKSVFNSIINLKNKNDRVYDTSNIYKYDYSYVKLVVDNWVKYELDNEDLVSVDGYKARLIDKNDVDILNDNSIIDYEYAYWAMHDQYCYYSNSYFDTSHWGDDDNFREKAIRPIINVKKNLINNEQIGDIISYKDNDYYIIKVADDYVTLFKKDALTQKQVNNYGERFLTNYDNALILTNSWAEKFKNDLISINGRTSGLLTLSDLFEKFNYDYCLVNSSSRICKSDLTPSCLDSDYWYWITDDGKYSLSEDQADKNLSMGPYVISWNSNKNLAVRPMLNVKKCAVDGACYEEEEEVPCEEEPQIIVEPEERIEKEPEKEKTIIEAENTFKTVSYILIIIGSLLIIGGYIFYKKIKKINN